MIVRELFWRYNAIVNSKSFKDADKSLKDLLKVDLFADIGARVLDMAAALGKNAENAARFADGLKYLEARGDSLAKLREQTRGLVDDFNLVKYANTAQTFGITAEQFTQAVNIADAAAKKLVISQDYAIESMIKGMSRGSVKWTDNVGIIVSQTEVAEEAIRLFGRKAANDTEKTQAYISRVLREGSVQFSKSAQDLGATASDLYDRISTRSKNLALQFGVVADRFAQIAAPPILNAMEKVTSVLERTGKAAEQNYDKAFDTAKIVAYTAALAGALKVANPLLNALWMIGKAARVGGVSIVSMQLALALFATKAKIAFAAAAPALKMAGAVALLAFAVDELTASLDDNKQGLLEELFILPDWCFDVMDKIRQFFVDIGMLSGTPSTPVIKPKQVKQDVFDTRGGSAQPDVRMYDRAAREMQPSNPQRKEYERMFDTYGGYGIGAPQRDPVEKYRIGGDPRTLGDPTYEKRPHTYEQGQSLNVTNNINVSMTGGTNDQQAQSLVRRLVSAQEQQARDLATHVRRKRGS